LVTAAAEQPPEALLNQLATGSLMVLPLGAEEAQQRTVISKQLDGQTPARAIIPVRFSQLETAM
jgi:protein-L-isoaspartate(D-aspartate) O-methyltransferase